MLAQLTVPFADASAGQLTWGLSPAAASPLASVSVNVGEVVLHLSVLGTSHQVDAHLDDGQVCVEAVTCGEGGSSFLPARAERDLGRFHYRFSSVVERLEEEAFSARALGLLLRLAPHPAALVASFPGHPDALTGVLAEECGEGIAWRTWHAYPRTGELVRTATRLVPR